jgi:hypothetical protein
MVGQTDPGRRRRSKPPCRGLDGLIADGKEVWLVVGRDQAEIASLLSAAGELTLCRSVLDNGVLVLGRASADRDPLLSEVLGDPELAQL